jgi:hypothetical protein
MANCGLLLNDGSSFILLNDGVSAILLNDATCATEPGAVSTTVTTGGGVGFASGWQAYWKMRKMLEDPQEYPGASPQYLRLLKKLRMYQEQLDTASITDAVKIEAKIEEIQLQLLGMK